MQLVTFRWLGVIAVLLLFGRRHIKQDWPILRQHLGYLGLMGCTGFVVFNALFYVAGHHTTAINIGILQGSTPVFVLLGSLFILRQKITGVQTLGVLVTLIGVIIVASGGDFGRLREFSTVNQFNQMRSGYIQQVRSLLSCKLSG